MATRILFFGKLRDTAGGATREADLPGEITDGAALIDWLCADDEALRAALAGVGVRLSVDQTIISVDTPFNNPKEIAFLPPFSGG